MKLDLKESLVTRDVPAMTSYVEALRVHYVKEFAAYDVAKPRRRKAESWSACVKGLLTKQSMQGVTHIGLLVAKYARQTSSPIPYGWNHRALPVHPFSCRIGAVFPGSGCGWGWMLVQLEFQTEATFAQPRPSHSATSHSCFELRSRYSCSNHSASPISSLFH